MKKFLITAVLLIALMSFANAAIKVVVDSPGDANFMRGTETIVFNVSDTNANIIDAVSYIGTVRYGDSLSDRAAADYPANMTVLISDFNLGNKRAGATSVCSGAIGGTVRKCIVTYNTTGLADGNYVFDVNVRGVFLAPGSGNETFAQQVDDANGLPGLTACATDCNSFRIDGNVVYIDNTTPGKCQVTDKRGNSFEWSIANEANPVAAGGKTTLYYSVGTVNKAPSYSSTSGSINVLSASYTTGKKEYNCYATDTAGNTGAVGSYVIEYPSGSFTGATIVVENPNAPIVAQSIAGEGAAQVDLAAWAQANWPILAVAGVLVYWYASSSKKGGKKKK